jgi:hypothetical protein
MIAHRLMSPSLLFTGSRISPSIIVDVDPPSRWHVELSRPDIFTNPVQAN